MKYILNLTFILCVILTRGQNIYLFAGMAGFPGYSGDGGPATSAQFGHPHGIAVDSAGSVYVADSDNSVIRKVNSSGIVMTVAGTGTFGYSGDGGQALSAQLGGILDLHFDKSGNLFLSDGGTNRIRVIDKTGIITTIAGSGTYGFSGDGGSALLADMKQPSGVTKDKKGNIYIADFGNNRIRKVDKFGVISTIVGTGVAGFSGDGASATLAEISSPYGVLTDTLGNLYIADGGNNRIRKVDSLGIISTIVGNGTWGYSGDGGPAISASIRQAEGMLFDLSGNLLIADAINNVIRKIDAFGSISTIAGIQTISPGSYAGDGGPALSAKFYYPYRIARDASGNIYVDDSYHNRIRVMCQTSCLAGINSFELNDNEIFVYPNPNNGSFNIQIENGIENGKIVLINTLGQRVYEQKVNQGVNEINSKELSKGLYNFILVQDKQLISKGKISIE